MIEMKGISMPNHIMEIQNKRYDPPSHLPPRAFSFTAPHLIWLFILSAEVRHNGDTSHMCFMCGTKCCFVNLYRCIQGFGLMDHFADIILHVRKWVSCKGNMIKIWIWLELTFIISKFVNCFSTIKSIKCYKNSNNRPDWKILNLQLSRFSHFRSFLLND